MSNYDVEMVKKFATLNKELIEKTAKDHPEIGGLIKQIIESITEESVPTTITGAPEETDVMWIPIQEAEDMKTLYKDKTITEQLEAVGRFMGSEKLFNLTLKEKSDLLISMLLMGDFYKLSNDPTKRQKFVEIYKQPLEDYETAIQYRINPALKEILGQDIVKPLGKDFVFDENFLETMGAFFPRRADLSDDELLELSKVLKNITVFNFLRNSGKDGFWYSDEAVWFKPSVVAKEGVVLNDEYGNRLEFDPDYLGVELGISLFPAPKPNFEMGDKVVLERTQNRQGEVGTIIKRYWKEVWKSYVYRVELSNVAMLFREDELEKFTKTKPNIPKPKSANTKQNTVIIENLEVYNGDLSPMNYDESIKKIALFLGNGWRLPTQDEIENVLLPNKNKIGNIKDDNYYWSNKDVGDGIFDVKLFNFKTSLFSVRYSLKKPYYAIPVRDLSTTTNQPTKPTLPTPSTPQEIEISLMSKDQLTQLKEEFEETLTYLDDTDPEKNDLLGQIKFLNLYLEN